MKSFILRAFCVRIARAALSAACFSLAPAKAEMRSPTFANPPQLQETTPAGGPRAETFAETLVKPQIAPRKTLDLRVKMVNSRIYNPLSDSVDTVSLRGYVGADVDPYRYVAPMIEVAPGQRVSITLHNELPADPTCAETGPMDLPHCFNGTNLHSHGLWVSPAGNSDNVLLSINPGKDFTYYYDLPDDHPSGTFWYHTHRHGSTALQVSSGMAGALIVRGNRTPTPEANGDLDTLLKDRDGRHIDERILVLQQIQYACFDAQGNIKTKKENGKVVAWICDPGDVGAIRGYNQFGPSSWAQSGRFTTINGLVRPRFLSRAGTVERWRMIHGGVRDTITVAFRARKPGAPEPGALSQAASLQYMKDYCEGEPIPYHLVAADGLTMKAAQKTKAATLQPGYRFDALVIFPQAGDYCVTNEPLPGSGSVSQQDQERQLLATIAVAEGAPAADADKALTDFLLAAAERTMPPSVRAQIVADLKDGLKLTRFTPHPDIGENEITGKQELIFFIDLSGGTPKFEIGNKSIDPKHFDPVTFKPAPYDPRRVDRVLPLGGVEEWTLQSGFVSHPFHIHVNPFQIVEILDPNGVDVSAPGAVDTGGGHVDPQYPGLKGVWKDTLWVKDLISNPADFPSKLASSMYTIKIRTRYQRYIGEYVLHCHILDHEDQGMMQNVCIELSDGGGGANCAKLHGDASGPSAAAHH